MKLLKSLMLVTTIVVMTACAGSPYGQKQTVGGLAGAALGGLLGAQFGGGKGQLASTAVGVLLGGLMGSEVGRSMDDTDHMKADQANLNARTAPLGQVINWNNTQNNHAGTVTPVRDGYSDTGNYCREFHQTVSIGGKKEEAYGVACRQADGTWRIIEG